MGRHLPEPPQLVAGLITRPSLSILAGKPKLGKSWLALALCSAIASDGYALGKIKVQQAEALYLGLEDNDRRLQSRLARMFDEVPAGLHLATSLNRFDNGGYQQLDGWLKENPACGLVVIDTLARVRSRRQKNGDIYAEDAQEGSYLQALAQRHDIAVMIVHHLRKAAAEDILDTISGTTGLTGAADTILVLTRQRGEADAVLHATGRDIEEQELALRFHADEGHWALLGEAREYAMSSERRAILTHLQEVGTARTPKEIADALKGKRGSIRHLVRKMHDEGLLQSDRTGTYTVHTIHNTPETPSLTREHL
jgi:RecA-family ATPase